MHLCPDSSPCWVTSCLPWSLVLALCACGAARPPASEATAAAHVENATRAAGTDLAQLSTYLCEQPPAAKPPQAEAEKSVAAMMAMPAPPPGQAFDNLFYVGAKWVSAWALKTSDGVILIDSLDNQAEAASLIEPGLRKFGMDPAKIKYVIITHGHGDHYGGANYLVQQDRPRIVMSDVDWTMTETKLEFDTPLWDRPPKRDIAAHDGDKITLGDTTVTLYLTPGHTNGTISPVFDVWSGGQRHRVLLWGGTAFNFGRDLVRLDSYAASTQRLRDIAQQQGIDVLLSNHPGFDNSLIKLDQLRTQSPSQPNPFVIGTPTVVRALTVMGECSQAAHDRFAVRP
jgi:metallo-beta-lactamase class B